MPQHIYLGKKNKNYIQDDKYIETKQNTIILMLKKNNNNNQTNNKFCLQKHNYTIFATIENITKLKQLYINSNTLFDLDFDITIGNVVWNQCKSILTNDDSKTLLIYSSDIKNKSLKIQTYKNKSKKNYINKDGLDIPVIVVNRGYGSGKYNFSYCLINTNQKYLIENHPIYFRDILEQLTIQSF